MANDVDIWKDVKLLEQLGRLKEADSLHKIYYHRYIGYNKEKLEQAKEEHYKKYKYVPNI